MALSTLAFAGAKSFVGTKSYQIVLRTPVKAGELALPAGEYKVKLDGAKAVFTDTKTKKSLTTDVKVKDAGHQFAVTAVDINTVNNGDRIDAIELGGSNTELDFTY
jgi:hypothetical protein